MHITKRKYFYFICGISFLSSLLGAFLLTLSPIQADGDTLMPTLVSIIHWTPFFWEQNRLGTLLPALTSWIHHPLYNFLTQTFLNSFLAMTAFFIGGQLFCPGRRGLLGSTLAVCASFVFLPISWAYHYFYIATPYGLSMFLFLLSAWIFKAHLIRSHFLFSKPWAWMLIFILLLLAQWVNFGLIPLVGLFLVFYAWSERQYKWLIFLGVVGFAFFLNYLFMRSMPYHDSSQMRWVSFAKYIRGFTKLTGNLAQEAWQERPWVLSGVSVLLILLIVNFFLGFRQWKRMVRILLPMCVAAIGFYFFVVGLKWLDMNLYSPRYVTLSLFLLVLAFGLFLAQLLPFSFYYRKHSMLTLGSLAVFFVVVPIISKYGLHSYASKRQAFEAKYGSYAKQALQWNATFIMGEYWFVWPTIFCSKWELYEQKRDIPLFGLSHRSFPTERMWRPLLQPGVRFAVFRNKPELIKKYMDLYKIGGCKEIDHTRDLLLLELIEPVHQ